MPTPIDDPTYIQRNRQPMHARWGAYPDAASAACDGPSPWVQSLDGQWAFHLAPRPDAVPGGCEAPGFDDQHWARIPVPANWELHGHGEAIYQNVAYPFPPNVPDAPLDNPTGCYRTAFTIPPTWAGRRIVLEFGSVDSAFHCWVNGHEVGFSTDSKLPASFDITDLVNSGANQLAVRVYRWPSSSYLEKQDYWHLSGIQRSVRIIAKPSVHLRDWCVQTRFDPTTRSGTVALRAWMSRPPGAWAIGPFGMVHWPALRGWTVAMTLRDPAGRVVAETSAAPADHSPMYGPASAGLHDEAFSAKAELVVPQASPWTAETPDLYTATFELRDPQGQAQDWERVRVGIREVAISDGVIRLNGQRLVFRGVNRHEFHPLRGRALTRADMREEVLAMKRLNFNAVRTCHYPDADEWYDLCDELGLYVVDEANLETHGLGALITRDPTWASAYLERAIRLCLRDRNHPSIVAWSLGNESHCGPNIAAMANWLRVADPTRPVQYESGFPGPLMSDIMVPMYPQLDWVRRVLSDPAERRPMVMCEYAYAKGNSLGNVQEFWDLVWELPRFQGGFMWDWRDKPIERDGRWHYGAPGREETGTERMCLNGVVGPDLVAHPGAFALKQAQSPVHLHVVGDDLAQGRVRLINRHQFLDLMGFQLRWLVSDDGVPLADGILPLPATAPLAEAVLQLPLPAGRPAPGCERHLALHVERIAASAWSAAGEIVGLAQFAWPVLGIPVRPAVATADLGIGHSEGDAVCSGPGWSLRLDRAAGVIASWSIAGEELLARPITPCVARAATDIDRIVGNRGYAGQWTACGLDRCGFIPTTVEVIRLDRSRALLHLIGTLAAPGLPPIGTADLRWTVHGNGRLEADLTIAITAEVDTIPRIGLVLSLHGADRRLRWFGRGPHEHYPDRREGTLVARHEAAVGEMLTPYVFPQECGLRCDVRHADLRDARGRGIAVSGDPLFHVSALPLRMEDLRDALNLADLRRRDETELHLDGFHMGLGGDTGWTRNVHAPYRLPPGSYRFRVVLSAIDER